MQSVEQVYIFIVLPFVASSIHHATFLVIEFGILHASRRRCQICLRLHSGKSCNNSSRYFKVHRVLGSHSFQWWSFQLCAFSKNEKNVIFHYSISEGFFLLHSHDNQSTFLGQQGWVEILMITLVSSKLLVCPYFCNCINLCL